MVTPGAMLGRKRGGGGGLLLLGLLVALLVAPLLRHRDATHPLAASTLDNLCPLLPPAPAMLGAAAGQPTSETGSATCAFRAATSDAVLLRVGMASTRQLSTPTPVRVSSVYATWIKEVAASTGHPVAPVAGDWAAASAWMDGPRAMLLVDDHGVLVRFESTALAPPALEAYAREAVAALRQADRAR